MCFLGQCSERGFLTAKRREFSHQILASRTEVFQHGPSANVTTTVAPPPRHRLQVCELWRCSRVRYRLNRRLRASFCRCLNGTAEMRCLHAPGGQRTKQRSGCAQRLCLTAATAGSASCKQPGSFKSGSQDKDAKRSVLPMTHQVVAEALVEAVSGWRCDACLQSCNTPPLSREQASLAPSPALASVLTSIARALCVAAVSLFVNIAGTALLHLSWARTSQRCQSLSVQKKRRPC